MSAGNSLAVQWLGLCIFTAKGLGSIPGWGMTSAAWWMRRPFASPLQSATTAKQSCLCPPCQDTREFHTSVHLKVCGLDHTEAAEPGGQQRWYLWPWNPSPSSQAHNPRELSCIRGDSAHNSSLLATVVSTATGEHVAVEAGPVIHPSSHRGAHKSGPLPACSSNTHKPQNPGHDKGTHDPGFPYHSGACNSGDPRHSGSAHHPSVPGGDQQQQGTNDPRYTSRDNKGTQWRVESADSQRWSQVKETKNMCYSTTYWKRKESPLIFNLLNC